MKRISFIAAGLTIFFLTTSSQEFVINELMTANASSILDKSYYNFSEWIEIYNPSAQLKSLGGYYLSNDSTNLKLWKVPVISVPAKGFGVIWFDKMNAGAHANFRIRSNRELVFLSNASGIIMDSVRIEFPYRDCSYGRSPDGSSTWRYFTQPTQGTSNTATAVYIQAPDPEFSIKGGRYKGSQSLILSSPVAGYTIRYTTSGSEPTESSSLYGTPIIINKTTTIKARAFAAGQVPSNTCANTYFINEHTFTIPVVSLSVDPKYLWDNTIGIYTDGTNGIPGNCVDQPRNWNRDWERFAQFEYFKPDGSRIINTGVGVKIAGGCSRGNAQKSFGISFRDKYGADNIRYPLFQSKQADRFTSLMLRNSGNDFNRTMFHDAMIQTLLIGEMDVDYNAYTPSAVYLNGEYWGILNTREKINDGYFNSNYGLDEDSVDFLEGDRVIIAGSNTDYNALINFIKTHILSSASNYQYVKDRIDIDEYINYMIANIYSGNADWPGNNLKYWKSKQAGSKWRWILYDMDFGFGLYGYSPDHNTLTFALEPNGPVWPNPPWSTLLFRKMIENDEFKNQFIDKFSIYIYSIYNPARVNIIIDSLKQIIAAEMPYHFQRWGGSMTDWENNINIARNYAALRPGYMMTYLQNFFSLNAPYTIRVSSESHQEPFVSLNDIIINDTLYEGSYFGNRPIKMTALPDKNHRFKQWKLKYSNRENIEIVTTNSAWKYLDDNTQPAASWKSLSYDDSSWKSGNGQLGYGDSDETTVLDFGIDTNNKYITYYFRKNFTIDDTAGIKNVSVNLLLDDGAVVYLNNEEIMRYNMPAGIINRSTFATAAIAEETRYYNFNLSNVKFIPGENVLAVELHQCSVTSTDISFDLQASVLRITDITNEIRPESEITLTLTSGIECIAEFDTVNAINNLYINEICSKNTLFPDEEYEFDDWIELYNSGDDTVNLAGLYLTNNLQVPTLFRISNKVSPQTLIPPHSYKLLWADGQSEQGLLHLDFKLDKDGGQVGIAHSTTNGIYYIDSLTYPAQKTDYSYGRYADGTSRWFLLSGMTPGESNIYTEINEIENFSRVLLYPNPANDILTVAFDEPVERTAYVVIYSALGQELIRKSIMPGSTMETIDISSFSKGVYFVTIANDLSIRTEKMLKN
jgi:hypothetical protein